MSGRSAAEYIDDPELRGNADPKDVIEACARRISEVDSRVGAFSSLMVDGARAAAQAIPAGPLRGSVIAVKDNIDVSGVYRTAGSKWFADYTPLRDAAVIQRIRDAGAVVIGKTAMAELGLGATTESDMASTRNPWDIGHTAGGSSGGSAAAVAADMCTAALGTDTGGSLRIPAHFCGVSALRPTLGSIDMTGILPVAPSLDTVGPMARTVSAVAEIFTVMTGGPAVAQGISSTGLTVGIVDDAVPPHPDISAGVEEVCRVLTQIGARTQTMKLPGLAQTARACLRLTNIEASIEYFDHVREHPRLFGAEVRRRLEAPDPAMRQEREALIREGAAWRQKIARVFEDVDVLLTPTAAIPAPTIQDAREPSVMGELGPYVHPWAFAALPAISVPAGFTAEGLPFGVQLVGPAGAERTLLELGIAFQSVTDWHQRRPAGRNDLNV